MNGEVVAYLGDDGLWHVVVPPLKAEAIGTPSTVQERMSGRLRTTAEEKP